MTVATARPTARPIRPGSREHRLMRQHEAKRTKDLIASTEHLIREARLLARHIDGEVEPTLEGWRELILDKMFGFIDGEVTEAELLATSAPLRAELARKPAQDTLKRIKERLPKF